MNNEKILLIERFLDGDLSEDELVYIQDQLNTDSEFKEEFVASCRFNGLLRAVSHVDLECEELIKFLDSAIGEKSPSEFEDKVIGKIKNINKPSRKKTKKLSDTARRRKTNFSTQRRRKFSRVEPPKSKGLTYFWMVAAASLALVCGIFFINNNNDSKIPKNVNIASIVDSDSGVTVIRHGERLNGKDLSNLCLNDKIMCDDDSEISLRYPDNTIIKVRDNSMLSFAKTENGGKKVIMDYGFLEAEVSKQESDKSFEIYSKNAVVTVIGTVFDITAERTSTQLKVKEGLVGFKRNSDKKSIQVGGGYYAVTNWNDFIPKPIESDSAHIIDLPPKKQPKVPEVVGFSLLNSNTGKVIKGYENITDGMVINMKDIKGDDFNILVNTIPSKVNYLIILCDGPTGKRSCPIEAFYPYSVFQDRINKGKGYSDWNPINGDYVIKATPYIKPHQEGKEKSIRFKVINAK